MNNVLLVFSSGYNVAFHGTEKMFREYVNILSKEYNVDLLFFAHYNDRLMKEFQEMPYRNLYKVCSSADQVYFAHGFEQCIQTRYDAVIFNDNVSNYHNDRVILSMLNFSKSYKVWHSPWFVNENSASDGLKNDDNIATLFDFNIFVSHYDKQWCLDNKPYVYNEENCIVLNNILYDAVPSEVKRVREEGAPLKIVYYGRLSSDKGINDFLPVVCELINEGKNITMDLYGHLWQYAPDKNLGSIKEIEEKTEEKVKFHPYDENIKDRLGEFDLSIISPYIYTNCLVVQEMVHAGLPFLSYSDVGVLKEFKFKGNHVGKSLKDILTRIVDNRALLKDYCIDPVRYFGKFKTENSYTDIVDMVKKNA